jgi:hypothetical protein
MEKYSPSIEAQMILYYQGLNERNRRHYASIEAQKLGHGGKTYICQLLGITQLTIRKADAELACSESFKEFPANRIRKKGGGRKKI